MNSEKDATKHFESKYQEMTPKSRALYERGLKVLPTGVGGAGSYMKPYPLYLKTAKGSKIIDIDDNEYIDCVCGAGPTLLGHNHPAIGQAVRNCVDNGICQTLFPYSLEVEFAEKINEIMPHMERIRYLPSGTEACHSAIRAARAFTGKDKFARFEGGYHGQDDQVLISTLSSREQVELAGSIDNPVPVASCAGIPKALLDLVVPLPFNKKEITIKLLEKNADDIACLITDTIPMLGSGGFPPDREFLKAIKEVTSENNILLIYDEIVTGFRVGGLGGVSKYFGVTPDLAVYGKICGGAYPLSMFGGRADVMDSVFPMGEHGPHVIEKSKKAIFQSGTYSGFPVSLAAGLAAIREIQKHDIYPKINKLGNLLRQGLEKVASEIGFDFQANGAESIFGFQFAKELITDKRDLLLKADARKRYIFTLGLITQGIFAPTGHSLFLNAAHTEDQINEILEAARNVLQEMKKYEN